jgi:hypothetical protein
METAGARKKKIVVKNPFKIYIIGHVFGQRKM